MNIIAAGISSLLPDIDTSHSTLGKILSPVLKPLHKNFDHRTITHSLLFVVFLGCFCSPLIIFNKAVYIAIMIGYLSHLVIDCTNKTGVPLLWPKPIYFIAPGNPRFRIEVGSIQEYVLCGILILLTVLIFYIQGLGFRSTFINVLANPAMAIGEYQSNANKYLMNASISGFNKLSQEKVENTNFQIVDSLDKNTLIVKNNEGRLITIGTGGSAVIQVSKLKIQKLKPIHVKTKVFKFNGNRLSMMFDELSTNSYVSGTVTMRMKPQYIQEDLQSLQGNEFESIKVSAGSREFEATLNLQDATAQKLKPIGKYSVTGSLVARIIQ